MTDPETAAPATIRCPTCGREVAAAGPSRPGSFPFCTSRCRLLDLGAWLDGRNAIPGRPGAGLDDEAGGYR